MLVDEVEMLLDGSWEASFSEVEDVATKYDIRNDNGGNGSTVYC